MDLNFQDGLIPAIIQDRHSGKVLMLGYMNTEAFEKTLKSGFDLFQPQAAEALDQGRNIRLPLTGS